MKHKLQIEIECSDNLAHDDIVDWVETLFKAAKVFFQSIGEIYRVEVIKENQNDENY